MNEWDVTPNPSRNTGVSIVLDVKNQKRAKLFHQAEKNIHLEHRFLPIVENVRMVGKAWCGRR